MRIRHAGYYRQFLALSAEPGPAAAEVLAGNKSVCGHWRAKSRPWPVIERKMQAPREISENRAMHGIAVALLSEDRERFNTLQDRLRATGLARASV